MMGLLDALCLRSPCTTKQRLSERGSNGIRFRNSVRPISLELFLCCALCLCHGAACSPRLKQPSDASQESIVQKVEKDSVELLVEITPKQPRLSDLINLSITITHPTSIEIEPPAFGKSVGDFTVRDYSHRTLSAGGDESVSVTDEEATNSGASQKTIIRYQLEPLFSGRHLVRSIPISFARISDDQGSSNQTVERNVLQTDPIEVEVSTELGDQPPDLSQVTPMADPLDLRVTKLRWLVVGGTVLLACGAALVWLLRRRRQLDTDAPQITPEELARLALKQLIAEQLPSKGLVKEFYLRLTGIVRVYIEGRTGLKAPEQTTEEFLRDMRSSQYFDAVQSNRLQEFLVAADLVKYAGQQPDELSIQQSLARAQEFISMRLASQLNLTQDEVTMIGSQIATGSWTQER